MLLHVRELGRFSFWVTVEESESIWDIKCKIWQQHDIPVNEQKLSCIYGIVEDHYILSALQLPRPLFFTLDRKTNKIITLELEDRNVTNVFRFHITADDTVYTIKSYVCDMTIARPDEQRVFFNGRQLEVGNLSEYGILGEWERVIVRFAPFDDAQGNPEPLALGN